MQRTPSHRRQTTSMQKVTGGQVTSQQTGRQGGTRVEDKVDLDIQRDQDLQEMVPEHQIVVDDVDTSKECLL